MSEKMAFSLDLDACSGCLACVVACRDQNDIKAPEAPAFRTVTLLEKPVENEPFIHMNFLSLACVHCNDAPCLMVCPVGAIFKDDATGAIGVTRSLCLGCHSCELACPFGAPKFAPDGKMAKCDFCYVRQQFGLKPACVHTCTTGALNFGQLDEISKAKTQKASLLILENVNTLG